MAGHVELPHATACACVKLLKVSPVTNYTAKGLNSSMSHFSCKLQMLIQYEPIQLQL